jgi:hypothetical protein
MLRDFQNKIVCIHYFCPELIVPSLITIFVQERERGCFNLVRDGASREHRESHGRARQSKAEHGGAQREYARAVGRAARSNYLDSEEASSGSGPLWASAALAICFPSFLSAKPAA